MLRLTLVIPLVMVLAGCAAQQQVDTTPRSAAWFAEVCQSNGADARAERAYCSSYLEGVLLASHYWEHTHETGSGKHFCLTSTTAAMLKPEDLRRVYVDWAARNPNQLDARMYEAAYAAIDEAFPC